MKTETLSDDELVRQCRKRIEAKRQTKLFHYTDEEELRIERAKLGAIRFMAKFGQGSKRPQIDLTRYENTNKTKWYDQRD